LISLQGKPRCLKLLMMKVNTKCFIWLMRSFTLRCWSIGLHCIIRKSFGWSSKKSRIKRTFRNDLLI
jgi:hypothetical protein